MIKKLQKAIEGIVRTDPIDCHIYAVDASILEVVPQIVVIPKHIEDIYNTIEIAREYQIPITPRGGATGIAGGCLGEGIVIDVAQYLNRILEINIEERWAICEPGVLQDQLNVAVAPYGLRLGPDTSTGNRATIGGMVATNAAGAHFLRYGNMKDHVLEIEMLLSTGEKMDLNHSSFPQLKPIIDKYRPSIENEFPSFPRKSSGYNLDALLENPPNLAKLAVGSQGTLGIFSKIKVKLTEQLKNRILMVLPFETLEECLAKVPNFLKLNPVSCELIDSKIIQSGRLSPALRGKLDWLEGTPAALLLLEFEETIPDINIEKAQIFKDAAHQESVWALRKAGLGLLLSRRGYSRAIAFIEDVAVPPASIFPFIKELKSLLKREIGIYGHVGDGCLHIRPFVNLQDGEDIKWMFHMMEKVTDLVKTYQGVISSEHGDGLIRSWLYPSFFSPSIMETMKEVKKIFDPLSLMNPGKIVDAAHPGGKLRKIPTVSFTTQLDFEKEGGLSLVVDLCNGNGACRKKTTLMCPSFQVTNDERQSTRARAQSLRSFLNENLTSNKKNDRELLDVLDYCLECKGCKTECPSQVDMAKMKMELLFQFQEKHGYFLNHLLFGNLPHFARFASKAPKLFNALSHSFLFKKILSKMGISNERPLPSLATKNFSKIYKENKQHQKRTVFLFIDTWTEYFSPEIGLSAVKLLEDLDYKVVTITQMCCGRTWLSKGLLKEAKRKAMALFNILEPISDPIIVLEPSCLSAITDDYQGLIGNTKKVICIEEFLLKNTDFKVSAQKDIFYHPHCHEQALSSLPLLSFVKGVKKSSAGCCGLAGSFGYEKKHFPMSVAIGRDRLFPEINRFDQNILASGFSCRQQIHFGTGKKAYHPAEWFLKLRNNKDLN